MSMPVSLRPMFASLEPATQIAVKADYDRRAKSLVIAYTAWLFMGWHYLYLRRVGLQFAFWLTLGGFAVWWLIDAFRLPGIVRSMNEDVARELMVQYKALS